MRISEVILSGLFFGIMARQCASIAIDSGGGADGYSNNSSSTPTGSGRILSRKRRFLGFPVGSSFSVAVCITTGVIGNPNYQYLSMGLNWGVAYNLPNSSWIIETAHGFGKLGETPEPVVKRRYRRELYQRLEIIMDRCLNMGLEEDSTHIRTILVILSVYIYLFLGRAYALNSNEYHNSSLSVGVSEKLKSERSELQIPARRRQKRYVAFPEGSSFTCAVCATVGVVGSPAYNYLSYGLNWGIAYDLPNETWIINHLHGFGNKREPYSLVKRRNRRSLYQSIENVIDSMGYNGRDCILRALCESKQFFQPDKLGMIPELLRTIFSLPKTRLFTREIHEHSAIVEYNRAYFTDEEEECELKYPCSFSLLELAMGKYSEPSSDYYGD